MRTVTFDHFGEPSEVLKISEVPISNWEVITASSEHPVAPRSTTSDEITLFPMKSN